LYVIVSKELLGFRGADAHCLAHDGAGFFSIHQRGGLMAKPLDPETLIVETYAPGPDEEFDSIEALRCTGCDSTCGILPP
jgi:hypothetical protein